MPRRQLRLIRTWLGQHLDELNADWELVLDHKPLTPIAPLV